MGIVTMYNGNWQIQLRKMDNDKGKAALENFPYADNNAPLLFVDLADQSVWQAHTVLQKRSGLLLANGQDSVLVFAAWPGTKRQDIFLLNPTDALEKFKELPEEEES